MIHLLQNLIRKKKQVNKEFVNNSKHFCMMPWVHFHITQMGTVAPCCKATWDQDKSFGNINEQSILQIWNSKHIRKFRSILLKDKSDDRCLKCYNDEKAGLYSLRQVTNDNYLHQINRLNDTKANGQLAEKYQPIYWDIRFSNLCNFKCRICGHWSSSKWFNDAKLLKQNIGDQALSFSYKDYNAFMSEIEKFIPYMEEIYFAGGEPLLMDEHTAILNMLIKNKKYDVKLRYNTNFSTLQHKGYYFPDIWSNFKEVLICASLDDEYERGELQRKGQDWEQTIQNRKLLIKEYPHIGFMLSPTMSVFNVFNIPNTHKNWVEQNLIDVADCWPNLLNSPKYYNLKILPATTKQALKKTYSNYIEWIANTNSKKPVKKQMLIKRLENCLNDMLMEDWTELIPKFKEKTLALDAIRDENTSETIPDLKVLLK